MMTTTDDDDDDDESYYTITMKTMMMMMRTMAHYVRFHYPNSLFPSPQIMWRIILKNYDNVAHMDFQLLTTD